MYILFVKAKSELSDAEITKKAEERMHQYRSLPGLVQKYYLKDPQTGEFGGVYIWESLEALKKFQQSELSQTIPQSYRVVGKPRVEVLEVASVLRPEKQTVPQG